MMKEIRVANLIDDSLYNSLRNLHVLVSFTYVWFFNSLIMWLTIIFNILIMTINLYIKCDSAAMFYSGKNLSDADSEASFIIRYFANNMECVFSDLEENVELKW